MQIPYQKEILDHKEITGHTGFLIYGTEGDSIQGLYCKECENFITKIKVISK